MHRLGLGEKAAKTAFCPFHKNQNTPAFSVYARDGRWWWHCFAGCGSGDEIAFLQELEGLDFQGAIRRWEELAGLSRLELFPQQPSPLNAIVRPSAPKVQLPEDFRKGSEMELQAVASLRNVSIWSVALMQDLCVLGFGTVCGSPCWIVTDISLKVAEARRIDGQKFPPIGPLRERKVHTLRGSSKGWPVGSVLPGERQQYFDRVLLCEGSGDLVAAYHFALSSPEGQRWLPVAVLGAGCQGARQTLPALLSGKHVRIIPHEDENGAGLRAAEDWESWLVKEKITGDIFDLSGLRRGDGNPVKDLNDCTRIHPEHQGELEDLLR
jgi:hypothetical protein